MFRYKNSSPHSVSITGKYLRRHGARLTRITNSRQHDKALDDELLTQEQRLAIHMKYSSLILEAEQRAALGVFGGWSMGLRKYVTDQASMFNIGVDMARQTAQAMQGLFQQFFFDLFEAKIQSLKTLLLSFSNFVKQIVSQVIAQLVTIVAMRALAGIASGGSTALMPAGMPTSVFGGGLVQRKYALGGPVYSNGDHVPALLAPGEFVVSRSGVDALTRMNQGSLPVGGAPTVTINVQGWPTDHTADVRASYSQFQGLVLDVIVKQLRNGVLRDAIRTGL